jgi:hypothetical protein
MFPSKESYKNPYVNLFSAKRWVGFQWQLRSWASDMYCLLTTPQINQSLKISTHKTLVVNKEERIHTQLLNVEHWGSSSKHTYIESYKMLLCDQQWAYKANKCGWVRSRNHTYISKLLNVVEWVDSSSKHTYIFWSHYV